MKQKYRGEPEKMTFRSKETRMQAKRIKSKSTIIGDKRNVQHN